MTGWTDLELKLPVHARMGWVMDKTKTMLDTILIKVEVEAKV